jgi:uncharacterized protein (TIGR04255 family)
LVDDSEIIVSEKYPKSPISESICEFRIPPDAKWDITIPGLLYERIKARFPEKEIVKGHELRLGPSASEGIHTEFRQRERIRFLTTNRKNIVTLDDFLAAISWLRPYESWEVFRESIENVYLELKDVVSFSVLNRIGMRYINLIEIPRVRPDLAEYFFFRPELGGVLGKSEVGAFWVGVEVPFNEGSDVCRIQITNAVPKKPEHSAFVLDLDYFLAKPGSVNVDGAMAWVDEAHRTIGTIFEGCLTDKSREVFSRMD